jgi:hypothetical protein
MENDMSRFMMGWFVVVLVGWMAGCTPAGKSPEDDSYSSQVSASGSTAESPAAEQSQARVPATAPEPVSNAPSAAGDAKVPAAEAESSSVPQPGDRTIFVGQKKMTAPENWVPKPPAMQMIAQEFSVPAAEGDQQDGRVTVMVAGGSIEANLDRWMNQFAQPDGSKTSDRVKVEKKTVGGQEVHLADLSGTYHDSRGMMGPAVDRPDYRMLAAIIPTAEGNYFIKFYGPKKTVSQNENAFHTMIEGLR